MHEAALNPEPSKLGIAALRAAMALTEFDAQAAQRLMWPDERGRRPDPEEAGEPRHGAALLYAHVQDDAVVFPLTLRRDDLREHRGQVSLPGGRPEPGETPWQTALREAHEEIGLEPSLPAPIGVLHPVYIPVTHTVLEVHVATGPAPVGLVAEESEVAALGMATLDQLLDPAVRRLKRWERRGREIDVPYFALNGWTVWGATAIALSELAERLRTVSA